MVAYQDHAIQRGEQNPFEASKLHAFMGEWMHMSRVAATSTDIVKKALAPGDVCLTLRGGLRILPSGARSWDVGEVLGQRRLDRHLEKVRRLGVNHDLAVRREEHPNLLLGASGNGLDER